jgi:hypothetical protein
MKGILFNHLEELTAKILSAEAWTTLCEELPLKTKERFILNKTYPDSDLVTLVAGISQRAKIPVDDVWRKFGQLSIPNFMKKYPAIVAQYKTPKDLLNQINYMHFTAVRNLFTDTELPYFVPQKSDDSKMVIRYISKRNMCLYLEGALHGLSEHYKTPIKFRQIQCVLLSGKCCEFEISC